MRRVFLTVLCAMALTAPVFASPSWLYFSDLQGIRAVQSNGSGLFDVIPNGSVTPIELRVDEAGGRVFFVNGSGANNWLSSAGVLGGPVQNIHQASFSSFINIAYDPAIDRVYGGNPGNNHILGVDPDGMNASSLVSTPNSNGFEVDPATGRVYYTERIGNRIDRVESNGTGNTTLLTTSLTPGMIDAWTVDLDVAADHMYFGGRIASDLTNHIQRANLDGTGFVDVLTTPGIIRALRLDVPNSKMYWAEGNLIRSANLDGTGITTVFTHTSQIWGLDVTSVPAPSGLSVFAVAMVGVRRRRR